MNLEQALTCAYEFLDEYSVRHDGFAPSGNPDEFVLEFQETYEGEDGTLVVVFGVRPEVDPDEPSAEILALGKQCLDAMIEAHPALDSFTIAMEFLN